MFAKKLPDRIKKLSKPPGKTTNFSKAKIEKQLGGYARNRCPGRTRGFTAEFFDTGTCVVPDADNFISCQEIADQRVWAAWILGAIFIGGLLVSITRKKRR
jgi:hypothetical protein